MLLYFRTLLIFAHSLMISMMQLFALNSLLKGISLKCVLPQHKSWHGFCYFFLGRELLYQQPLKITHFFPPFLCLIYLSLHRPIASLVRRLHPGKHWHHPVTGLPRLLPTQLELHVDNRDLPRQRWAEESAVKRMQPSNVILFPPPGVGLCVFLAERHVSEAQEVVIFSSF